MNEGVAFNAGSLFAALAREGGAIPNVLSKKSFTAILGGTAAPGPGEGIKSVEPYSGIVAVLAGLAARPAGRC
jgi:hypothetical protein